MLLRRLPLSRHPLRPRRPGATGVGVQGQLSLSDCDLLRHIPKPLSEPGVFGIGAGLGDVAIGARSPGGRAAPALTLPRRAPAGDAAQAPREHRPRRRAAPRHAADRLRGLRQAAGRHGGPDPGALPDCPPTYDEAVFERLRAWRLERSKTESSRPTWCSATRRSRGSRAHRRRRWPSSRRINGVGAVKLERYGAEVLALLRTGDAGMSSPRHIRSRSRRAG